MTSRQILPAPGGLDRRSPVPLYFQLKLLLAGEIEHGRWAPEQRIPSESELCERYGVSRTTVRQALGELELDGRLRKEKGRGTFVAEPRSSSWFRQSSHGFHDEATRAGRTVTSKVLRNAVEPLPRWATDALDLPPGAEGVILERLRYVDGELVMYVESHLRAGLAEAIDEQQLATGSLYEALRSRFGVEVAGGRRVVDATAARKRIAGLLEVEEGAPLLFVEAVSWDSDLRPFECYRAWHRSDRTRINVHVVSERAAATAGVDATTLRLSRSAGR